MPEQRNSAAWAQGEIGLLKRENAELYGRADEAEGGLAAAQAEMETVSKALGAELAALRSETRRRGEEAALAHETEVPSFSPAL